MFSVEMQRRREELCDMSGSTLLLRSGFAIIAGMKATMNASDIKKLIHSGETGEVEFKPDQTVLTVKLDASSLRKTSRKKTMGKSVKTRGKELGLKTEDMVVLRLTSSRVIDAMRDNPKITREELAGQLNVTLKGIEWQVAKLQKDKIIRRVGGRKFGSWDVLKGATK